MSHRDAGARSGPWWLGALLLAGMAACSRRVETSSDPAGGWVASWAASPQLTEPRNLPPAPGLQGSTLRQVVRLTLGGRALRLRLSNEFGSSVVVIRGARVARSAGGGVIERGTDRRITFGGAGNVTIAAGAFVWSDRIDFELPTFADLAVSLLIDSMSADVTGHPGSRATSYLQSGDLTTAEAMPHAVRTEHWYVLSGADVFRPGPGAAVVTLGNSITDGRGSITDGNTRWPDFLARRLQSDPRTRDVAVLNAGIGGNAVVRGGLGPTALARLDRDVLARRGARWLVVLEGVNDIGAARDGAQASKIADDLIAAYREISDRSRSAGLRVYGATILPFGGSFYDDSAREAARQTVNRWIRSSGAWDAVIDFDRVMRDATEPRRLRRETDSGDHLHPNSNGYRLMAEAIDLALFMLPSPRSEDRAMPRSRR